MKETISISRNKEETAIELKPKTLNTIQINYKSNCTYYIVNSVTKSNELKAIYALPKTDSQKLLMTELYTMIWNGKWPKTKNKKNKNEHYEWISNRNIKCTKVLGVVNSILPKNESRKCNEGNHKTGPNPVNNIPNKVIEKINNYNFTKNRRWRVYGVKYVDDYELEYYLLNKTEEQKIEKYEGEDFILDLLSEYHIPIPDIVAKMVSITASVNQAQNFIFNFCGLKSIQTLSSSASIKIGQQGMFGNSSAVLSVQGGLAADRYGTIAIIVQGHLHAQIFDQPLIKENDFTGKNPMYEGLSGGFAINYSFRTNKIKHVSDLAGSETSRQVDFFGIPYIGFLGLSFLSSEEKGIHGLEIGIEYLGEGGGFGKTQSNASVLAFTSKDHEYIIKNFLTPEKILSGYIDTINKKKENIRIVHIKGFCLDKRNNGGYNLMYYKISYEITWLIEGAFVPKSFRITNKQYAKVLTFYRTSKQYYYETEGAREIRKRLPEYNSW